MNPNDPFKCRFKRPISWAQNLKNLFRSKNGKLNFHKNHVICWYHCLSHNEKFVPSVFDLFCVWQSRQSPAFAVATVVFVWFLDNDVEKSFTQKISKQTKLFFLHRKMWKILSYRELFSNRNFFVFVLASKATFSTAADNENIFVCLIFRDATCGMAWLFMFALKNFYF